MCELRAFGPRQCIFQARLEVQPRQGPDTGVTAKPSDQPIEVTKEPLVRLDDTYESEPMTKRSALSSHWRNDGYRRPCL